MLANKKIRVLVVDDSAFMRKAISIMISDDPDIDVVGTANNGADGLQKVHDLSPDLVTMDIEMPQMDGLTALRKIMEEKPTPVMMVSSLTSEGAQATLEALELGAVDFIPKQLSYVSLDIVKIKEELIAKIKYINGRKRILMSRARNRGVFSGSPATPATGKKAPRKRPAIPTPISMPASSRSGKHNLRIVAIGTSTGGPPALQAVIPRLPKEFPVPVLVVQHMPPTFTASLANRLNSFSALTVKEAENGDRVERGTVFIAPGDKHMTLKKNGAASYIHLSNEPTSTLYRPCVDIMMNSVEDHYKGATLGVIMTGMGSDGVVALKRIKQQGGVVIAQNEDSCVVYGMPRAAVDAGIADKITPVERIANEIVNYF